MFGGDSSIAGIKGVKSLTGSERNLPSKESSTLFPILFWRLGLGSVGVDCKALDLLYCIVGGRGRSPDCGGGKGTFGGDFERDVNSGRLIIVRVRDLGRVMVLLDDDLKSSSESESLNGRGCSGGM